MSKRLWLGIACGVVVILAFILLAVLLRGNNGPQHRRSITVARCVGYCNLPLFLASGYSRQPDEPLEVKLRYIANPGDHPAALTSPGGPQASVTPFTNVAAAYARGAPVRIIAGSGMNGLAIVSRPDIKTFADLAGKKIGTFRGDTLEVLVYEALKANDLLGEVEFVYFADALEPLTALKNGEIQAVTHVEPFVTDLAESHNMNILTRGEELWGTDHPDCVLVASEQSIAERREDLKDLILLMARGQLEVEGSPETVAQRVAEPFYDMSPSDLLAAVRSQFPAIDIRGKKGLIIEKSEVLVALGYIERAPDENLFDLSLLEEVIKENGELFKKLKHKY
jgi:NitT/TauT family transport system substrate-binding protein